MTRQMTGAKMVVQALKDQGVDTVFGYPGGAVLPIYDEIFQQDDIRHILCRHEQKGGGAAPRVFLLGGLPGRVRREAVLVFLHQTVKDHRPVIFDHFHDRVVQLLGVLADDALGTNGHVSYTHMTLPTSELV